MNNTHEKIITAAKELFEKKGFAAATTKEIAQLAGVSEVTLFRHFETKRKLFEQTVHSCIHPYQLKEFLSNEIIYDLEHDLTYIASSIKNTHMQNMPMIRMIMRDAKRGSFSEKRADKNEHFLEKELKEYFQKMKELGKLSADPDMAMRFFTTSIMGYIMKEIFQKKHHHANDDIYFAWMLKKVIEVLKS